MKLPWLVVGCLAFAACSNPQQIVLSVDTTAGVPCEIDHIRIRAKGSKEATFERDVSNVRLPLVVRLSDETARGSFDLEVTGLKGDVEVLQSSGPLQFGNGGDLAAHVVLESSCTLEAPCKLPDLTPFTSVAPPVTARFDCGVNVRRYTTAMTAEIFSDACTVAGANVGKVLSNGGHGATMLPLPDDVLSGFGFRFYGKPIRQIWAHEDGYIAFTPGSPDPGNDRDPGAFDRDLRGVGVPPPPQSVMVFWDQLTLSSDGICYSLEGSPGTQKLRVTWAKSCQTNPCVNDSLNFTIVLDERAQRIALTYGEMTARNTSRGQGGSATVGIVNDAKGCVVSDCTFATGLCKDGVTPCGYSQEFSNTPQTPSVQNIQFDPVVDPN